MLSPTPITRCDDLPPNGWRAEIVPSPRAETKRIRADEIFASQDEWWTLANVGIMPGSTLRIQFEAVAGDDEPFTHS